MDGGLRVSYRQAGEIKGSFTMTILDRRAVIAGAASVGAIGGLALPGLAQAGSIPASGRLDFAILRNGKPFGSYRVTFVTAGDLLTVTTDVAMNMKIAKLTVLDYRHHCEELWRKGQFSELHSHTIRDNNQAQADTVNATRGELGIHIVTNKGPLSAPSNALPLTHWNMAALGGPMFNPQDGLMLQLQATNLGRDGVLTAKGAQLIATHWTLRGAQSIDDWYDDNGIWAGLKGQLPDKSTLEYRRI